MCVSRVPTAALCAALISAGCGGSDTRIRDLVPDLVVLPESIDFGEVIKDETSTVTLTLTNAGRDILILQGSSWEDGTAGVFDAPLDPQEVERGDSIPLDVTFTPTSFDTWGDALLLAWNSEDGAPTEVPVAGTGIDIDRPDIDADLDGCLDFGVVAAGDSDVAVLTISNLGEDDLLIDQTTWTGSGAFSLSQDLDGLSVSAGGVLTLLVTYAPTVDTGDETTVTIFSNDPDEPEYTVCFIGNGGGDGNYPVAVVDCPADPLPGGTVSFDGSASYDPGDNEPLTYAWTLSTAPSGSQAVLESLEAAASLTTDVAGTYTVSLVATNTLGIPSAPESCQIEAIPAAGVHIELVWDGAGTDVDLHLSQAGASLYETPEDVSYCNDQLDWGVAGDAVDDPALITDDDGLGPEIIEIEDPADGEYMVRVHYFEDNARGDTLATVRFYIYGELTETATQTLTRNQVWDVGYIRWPYGYVIVDEIGEPVAAENRSCWAD